MKLENKIIEVSNKFLHSVSGDIIENIDFEDGKSFIQLEYILNDVICDIEYDLMENNFISEDDNLKNIIDNSSENIRSRMFDIVIDPVVKHFENCHCTIEINKHFEEITIYA